MTKIFIPATTSFQRIKEITQQVEMLDIEVLNTNIGTPFEDFAAELSRGDNIIVPSLDIFPSLIDLLAKIAELQERGITLRSIEEPWLNKPVANTTEFLEKLRTLAFKMHASRTKQGMDKARSNGKVVGRPVGWRKNPIRKLKKA